MRFSLKWLLVGVAYVAVVCASLASPSDFWRYSWCTVSMLLFISAAIVAACGDGRIRSAAVGFAITWLVVRCAMFPDWSITRDLHNISLLTTGKIARLVSDHDEGVRRIITRMHAPEAALGRILKVSPHDDDELALVVELSGKTSSEAQSAVFVIPLADYEAVPRDDETKELVRQHLLFQLAILGGCVGLWASRSKGMPPGPSRP